MYLMLEKNGAVLAERVVALVRGDGETGMIMRDGAVEKSCFTPFTICRRSEKFWTEAINGWKEQHVECRTKRS